MKTSELTGAQLDWAVAQCEGYTDWDGQTETFLGFVCGACTRTRVSPPDYSTDWAIGGPIIEREKIGIGFDDEFGWMGIDMDGNYFSGSTPLEAVMRCYVISKLGNEIDIPEELA